MQPVVGPRGGVDPVLEPTGEGMEFVMCGPCRLARCCLGERNFPTPCFLRFPTFPKRATLPRGHSLVGEHARDYLVGTRSESVVFPCRGHGSGHSLPYLRGHACPSLTR